MAETMISHEHKYGDEHELQRIKIWEFPQTGLEDMASESQDKRLWLIYIHGGAWRDPMEDMHGIEPTINNIHEQLGSMGVAARSRIAGFATINYRLSVHPTYPQDPAATPASQLRVARHPDHVEDVAAAMAFLAEAVPGSLSRYVVFGHSCGATLAFQLLMGSRGALPGVDSVSDSWRLLAENPPAAVVGFEGIYDLRGLNSRMGGAYNELFAPPFGPDEDVWDRVSPAKYTGFGESKENDGKDDQRSGTGLLAVVAHSPEDELVDMPELDAMQKTLQETGVQLLSFTDLKGSHKFVREDGTDIARVLIQTLETLRQLESLNAAFT